MLRRYYEGNRTLRLGYDFYADIAERIVEKRKSAGLTQQQLSKKSNVSVDRLKKYEEVRIRCKLDDLDKIADALGTTTDYLIGAEYDDPDCGECLYSVWNERYETGNEKFTLFFEASSAQRAFLLAYQWSLEAGIVWFECRYRARIKLDGVPVRKTDYVGLFRKREYGSEDELFPD